MISDSCYEAVMANEDRLNSAIIYDRDFSYVGFLRNYAECAFADEDVHVSNNSLCELQNYFGYKTLERSYLLRINGKVAERPQHLLMRVAVGIHGHDVEKIIESYNLVGYSLTLPCPYKETSLTCKPCRSCRCPRGTLHMLLLPCLLPALLRHRCLHASWLP